MHASLRGFAAGVAVLALAACGDSATSPRQIAPRAPAAPAFDFTAIGSSLGLYQTDFAVGSQGGSFTIGGLYTLNFPDNSVCDPSRSTYGEGEWDKSCTVLDAGQYVKIHAVLSLSANGLSIDFTPALRFSPNRQVTISTDIFAPLILANKDYYAKNKDALNAFTIFYSSTLGGPAIKDFATDRGVITHIDMSTGRIWRRVKHFSGYSIVTGEACEPSPDNPECVEVDGVR
jgi:hypothetical protein